MYVCECVCVYVDIYIYIYIHTYCQDDVDELVLQCQELLLQSYTHVSRASVAVIHARVLQSYSLLCWEPYKGA